MNNREPENREAEALKKVVARLEMEAAVQRQAARSEISRLRGIIEHQNVELAALRGPPQQFDVAAIIGPIFAAVYGYVVFKWFLR